MYNLTKYYKMYICVNVNLEQDTTHVCRAYFPCWTKLHIKIGLKFEMKDKLQGKFEVDLICYM